MVGVASPLISSLKLNLVYLLSKDADIKYLYIQYAQIHNQLGQLEFYVHHDISV